jgi:hypothetical protein
LNCSGTTSRANWTAAEREAESAIDDPEAETLVKQASSMARIPATTSAVQAALAANKDAVILLLKR